MMQYSSTNQQLYMVQMEPVHKISLYRGARGMKYRVDDPCGLQCMPSTPYFQNKLASSNPVN